MPYGIKPDFAVGGVYHLYNRSVAKQDVFVTNEDIDRFLLTLSFYREAEPEGKLSALVPEKRHLFDATMVTTPLVEILAYCIMPTHFHLVVRQTAEAGVSTFMRRALNSFTRAFNTRHHRVGAVFQGVYQAVAVESDEQLLHLSRYVHLNPYVARLVTDALTYRWSSLGQVIEGRDSRLCHGSFLHELAGSGAAYQAFVTDYAEYARDLAAYRDILLDIAD